MKTYIYIMYFFMIFSVISCKKKEIIDPYGDPKYFVKVRVISIRGGAYGFNLLDGSSVLVRTEYLTNNNYSDKYKIRENYPVSLRVTDWDNKYVYWDSNLVLDDAKENFEIPLVMDTNKNLRILMSEDEIEKYYLDFEIPSTSGISVIVQDETSDARYVNVFTESGRIYFLKSMNIIVSATNQSGVNIQAWRINSSGSIDYPSTDKIKINNISSDYIILPIP